MERGGRRAAAHHLPVAGELGAARLRPVRPGRVHEDEPDGLLLGSRRPGRRRPSRRRRRPHRAARARPAAIACAASAETAPCSLEDRRAARRARSSFTPFAYATTPPRKTSLEPGTLVSRAATRPPVHDSAVASVSPARAAEVEDDLRDRALVLAEEVLAEPVAQRLPRSRPPRSSPPGSTTRSTWISNSRAQIVASTPSPSPPARSSACATADSGVPKNRSARRSLAGARSRTRRTGSVSSARGQRRCSSRGGPGRTTTAHEPASRTMPGRRAREAERDARPRAGSPACGRRS